MVRRRQPRTVPTMSSIACASTTKGGSRGFGSFGKFTFRYTPVLRPRGSPAMGDLAPVAHAGSEGRGRRATEGRRRPVGRSLCRRRAVGGLRTRNLRADGASRRSRVGGTDREAHFGRDPARLVPAYRAQRAGRRPGNEPSRVNSMTSAMIQASQSPTITTSAPPLSCLTIRSSAASGVSGRPRSREPGTMPGEQGRRSP